jgi:hypothetical protein
MVAHFVLQIVDDLRVVWRLAEFSGSLRGGEAEAT